MNYPELLKQIRQEISSLEGEGKIADYIPELAKVSPDKFGMNILFNNGEEYGIGDMEEKFSIQSISKVFILAIAMSKLGNEIWQRVDMEPSGNPFNSLVQLEYEKGLPRNPFINAGSLVLCDILISEFSQPKEEVLSLIRKLAQTEDIHFNKNVAESEEITGFHNKALANLIKSYGNMNNSVEEVLNLYSHICSIEMTCRELTKAFLIFANHGENIITNSQSKRLNAIMLTCGFYDEAGEFAFRVGLPGKSGVGGGIVAILPNNYSVAVWSPRLNKKGNSVMGMKALEIFTTKTGVSLF